MYQNIDAYIDRLISGSSPEAPLWNIESIKGGKPPHWNYIDGCMITSLLEIGRITGDAKYFSFAESFVDYYVRADGSILGYDIEKFNLDDVNEGRVLFELYAKTGKEKYLRAIHLQAEHLRRQPRTSTGNFWHKAIYPNQIWLDGLYMAQVFATLHARELGGGDYSDVLMQIRNVAKYMRDPVSGLYYHGMDCSRTVFWADRETGLSRNFWLRSIGWFTVALVDIIEICTDPATVREISEIFRDLTSSLLPYRDSASGMYWQVVDRPGDRGNYLETSGSCMIAYAMLKGARLGVLSPDYASLGKATFDGVCDKYLTAEGGELNLGGICLVAGLGPAGNTRRDGSYEYYVSEPIVENDAKGVAPFILAYTEILRGR